MISSLKQALAGLRVLPGQLGLISRALSEYDPARFAATASAHQQLSQGLADLRRELSEIKRASAVGEVESRFRRALTNLGVAPDAIERFVAGTDIEGDHVTHHEADLRRQLTESKSAHEYWHDNYVEKVGQLEKQLGAEREARAEAEQHWNQEHENGVELTSEIHSLHADMDALTRWRKQSEEPCPIGVGSVWMMGLGERAAVRDVRHGILASDEWRHTPESLAALKARKEGGGDG